MVGGDGVGGGKGCVVVGVGGVMVVGVSVVVVVGGAVAGAGIELGGSGAGVGGGEVLAEVIGRACFLLEPDMAAVARIATSRELFIMGR